VIRDVNMETQQRRHRSEEAFRLPQTQVIDGTSSQRSLDGQVRIDALTTRLPASGRVPRFTRFFGEPKRQLATLSKGGFVRRLPWCTTRDFGPQLPVLANSRFPMSIFKRTQRKCVKKGYRVRNLREYETGLRDLGSLTVWISLTDGKLPNWDAPRPMRRKPGRQRKYSNHAIETAVILDMDPIQSGRHSIT
jgi:hypothetical protein